MNLKTEPVKPLKPEPLKKPEERPAEPVSEASTQVSEPRRKILPNKSSMGSLLKEVNEQISARKTDENKIALTGESLPVLWKSFLEHIRHKAQNSFMAVAEEQDPSLEEELVVFNVPNNISLEMLHLHKTEITAYFLSKTTAKVQLDFRLEKRTEEKTYKRPKDRLMEMIHKNEAVNKLIQKFDLNLD